MNKTLRKLKKQFLRLLIFVVFVLIITNNKFNVKAQNTVFLTVSPARQEITVNPGEELLINVRYYNRNDYPVSGIIKVADFIIEGKEENIKIMEDVFQVSSKYSSSTWFSLPFNNPTIAVEDKITIPIKINVPSDASPGGHYVSIYFEPVVKDFNSGNENKTVMTISSRIVALVYLKVAGQISEKASLSNFSCADFLEHGPITVETGVLNSGDYHIRPNGVITLSNIFGGFVDQKIIKEKNIFPGTIGSYKYDLGKRWMIGRYKLNLAISYGEKGQALHRIVYVWIFPWKIAILIVLTVIILFFIINHQYKKLHFLDISLKKYLSKRKQQIDELKNQLRKKRE